MDYRFKQAQEIAWFGFVAAGIALLEVLLRWEPDAITEWETWAVSVGGGLIRAFAGGALAAIANPND